MGSVKTENKPVECGILYSIFKYKTAAMKDIVREIEPSDFAIIEHRRIANILFTEYEKSGNTFSIQGIYTYICGLTETTDEDKIKYKSALDNIKSSGITLQDVVPHCRQIRELHGIRKLLKSIGTNLDDLDRNQSIDDVLSTLEKDIQVIKRKLDPNIAQNITSFKNDVDERIKHADMVDKNPTSMGLVRTGFKNFDKWLPPISPGSLVLYQARTNKGKSMFLMGTALANREIYGNKVIIITIEMSNTDYANRMDSNVTGIEHSEIAKGTISKDPAAVQMWKDKVVKFGDKHIAAEDIMIYWVPENCTPAKIDAIISSNPFKPDLVIVDYAGDMKSGIKGLVDYDPASFGFIYSRLKELAGKHRCVIVSAQQTKRGAKRVTDETGSWSDVASHKSDIMIAIEETKEDELHEEEVEGDRIIGRLTISIIKGRNIPKLKTHIVPRFHKMRWLEKEMQEPSYTGGIEYGKTDKQKTKEASEKMEKNTEESEQPEELKSDEMLDGLLN